MLDRSQGEGPGPRALPLGQRWKTDRFLVPFRPGALFSVASYLRPGLSP